MKSEKYASTLRLCLVALLLTITSGAMADPIAQAIWCSDNHTLYFTYDELYSEGGSYNGNTITYVWSGLDVTNTENGADWSEWGEYDNWSNWIYILRSQCTTVVFDDSFAAVRPLSCKNWFFGFTQLTSIQGLSYLNTSEVTDMKCMFFNTRVTSLDLSNFNTSEVTTMESMFKDCITLTTLDLSTFNTSKVESMVEMFSGCKTLSTLTVGSGWRTMEDVGSREDMFKDCTPSTYNIRMDDNADNTGVVSAFADKTVNATLLGRTLYKDGKWNTMCLPFNVTVGSGQLAGATAMTLNKSTSGFNSESGVLTLNFDNVASGSTIPAGKPFIVKWTGTNVTNPEFSGVTLANTVPSNVPSSDSKVHFIGTYSPVALTANTSANLYMGDGNNLHYPTEDMNVNAFRAYFTVDLDPSEPGGGQVRAIVLNFGDENDNETTVNSQLSTINSSNAGAAYDLSGRRISASSDSSAPSALPKGVYIINGRIILIK